MRSFAMQNKILSFCFLSLTSQLICAQNQPGNAVILEFSNEPFTDYSKGYSYSFETSNNIKVNQRGEVDDDGNNLSLRGTYSFVDPSGTFYKVVYIADKNGYHVLPEEKVPKPATVLNATRMPLSRKRISSKVIASLAGGGLG